MAERTFDESTQECFQAHFLTSGFCDAQTILPEGGQYRCHCTCGRWDVLAPSEAEGLELAREHTSAITERALARAAEA